MSMPASAPLAQALAVRIDESVPVLVLPRSVPWEELRDLVREQIPPLLDRIDGRTSRLDLGDREVTLFDLRRLANLLKEEFSVDVTGIYARPEEIRRFAERELKLKIFPPLPPESQPEQPGAEGEGCPAPEDTSGPDAPTAEDAGAECPAEAISDPDAAIEDLPDDAIADAEEEVRIEEARERVPEEDEELESTESLTPPVQIPEAPAGRRTQFVQRTLRSGNSVRFDGDIVVLGDVNPGAQVACTGNVIVLGALKGVAHAGSEGAEDAFILSFDLKPTQIRIARKIAIPPDRSGTGARETEIARIAEGRIVIEPYRTRNSR